MTDERHSDRTASRAKWVFMGFILIAAYFVLTEHRAHLSGLLQYLPLLLLLACPLMHVFMHGRHRRHRHTDHQPEYTPTKKEAS
jgi:hypothetical protein